VCVHTDGLACTATSTTTTSFYSILFKVGVISVTRAGVKICFGVIFWTVIFIFDEDGYWSAKGNTMFETGLQVNDVFFISLKGGKKKKKDDGERTNGSGEVTLTWTPTIEL